MEQIEKYAETYGNPRTRSSEITTYIPEFGEYTNEHEFGEYTYIPEFGEYTDEHEARK